jgi:SAM-dependent methyltransferase
VNGADDILPPAWLGGHLAAIAGKAAAASMLDIECGPGHRLAQAENAGVEPFGVSGDPEVARRNVPDAYVVETIEEIPPRRFDLILLLAAPDSPTLRALLYTLANKNAFGVGTVVIVSAPNEGSADRLGAVLRDLRFHDRSTHEDSGGWRIEASGSDFPLFMQERYVPGTWSEIAAYEHLPRYAFVSGMVHGARVLDFGCGSGYGAMSLARAADSVTGLDNSEAALAFARAQHAAPNLSFVRDAEFGASLPDGSFDVIVCFEVIEHLDGPSQAILLPSLKRLLAPGGMVVVSTPNPDVTAMYGANPYHLRELTLEQFSMTMQDHFPHVRIFEQSVMVGVFLQRAGASAVEIRPALDGMDGPANPAIFLAVCTTEPMAAAVSSAVYIDRRRDFIGTRVAALTLQNEHLIARYQNAKLRTTLARAEAVRVAAEQTIQAVQSDARRLEQEVFATRAEFAAVLEDRRLLQATYDAELQKGGRLAEALAALQAEFAAVLEDRRLLQGAYEEELASLEVARSELHDAREEGNTMASLYRKSSAERDEMRLLAFRAQEGIAARDQRLHDAERLAQERAEAMATLLAELAAARQTLHAMETSTAWRAIRKAAPVLRAARPVLRPVLRSGYGLLRRLTRPAAPPAISASSVASQDAEAGPATDERPATRPPDRNMARETALDPVWDRHRGAFVLVPETTCAQKEQPTNLAGPYVVVPVTPIDPTATRRKVLHVIPNVHVGGSTQLVIDLVQHLSSGYQHEVLTSSLWPGGAHQGLVVHLVAAASAPELGAVIDAVGPDLVHMHYWGLTDDPWYFAVVEALAARRVPAVQNVNTPIAPLPHDTFRHYVFVSEYVRQTFGGGLDAHTPTSVIHPGIDLARFGRWSPAADRDNAVGMVYRLEDDKLNRLGRRVHRGGPAAPSNEGLHHWRRPLPAAVHRARRRARGAAEFPLHRLRPVRDVAGLV